MYKRQDRVAAGGKAIVKIGSEKLEGSVSSVTPLSKNGVISFTCLLYTSARLVPHVVGKEITVEDGFHFMFRQVAVVEGFCLLE